MRSLKERILAFISIAKYIIAPELIEYNYEIIPFNEVRKMKRQRLISEYIRSRRRIDEYINLTRKSIWLKHKILLYFNVTILLVSILSYIYQWRINMRPGDLVFFSLIQLTSIQGNIKILLLKANPIIEERVTIEKIVDLKAKLIESLKYEWNYMDNQNKLIASAQATLKTLTLMLFITSIQNIIFLEIKHTSILSILDKIKHFGCETVHLSSLGITFNPCNYFSLLPFILLFILYMAHELAILLSSPQSSGAFFSNQSLMPNFISSVYLDNLSLSVLNPNQHETL